MANNSCSSVFIAFLLAAIVVTYAAAALNVVIIYVLLPIGALVLGVYVIREIHWVLNPEKKQAYLERKAREAEMEREEKAREGAEKKEPD
jgi:phosphate/sulfate permease